MGRHRSGELIYPQAPRLPDEVLSAIEEILALEGDGSIPAFYIGGYIKKLRSLGWPRRSIANGMLSWQSAVVYREELFDELSEKDRKSLSYQGLPLPPPRPTPKTYPRGEGLGPRSEVVEEIVSLRPSIGRGRGTNHQVLRRISDLLVEETERGISPTALARETGISVSHVCHLVGKYRRDSKAG